MLEQVTLACGSGNPPHAISEPACDQTSVDNGVVISMMRTLVVLGLGSKAAHFF